MTVRIVSYLRVLDSLKYQTAQPAQAPRITAMKSTRTIRGESAAVNGSELGNKAGQMVCSAQSDTSAPTTEKTIGARADSHTASEQRLKK